MVVSVLRILDRLVGFTAIAFIVMSCAVSSVILIIIGSDEYCYFSRLECILVDCEGFVYCERVAGEFPCTLSYHPCLDPFVLCSFDFGYQALLKHSTEAMKESRVFEILTSVCLFSNVHCTYAVAFVA